MQHFELFIKTSTCIFPEPIKLSLWPSLIQWEVLYLIYGSFSVWNLIVRTINHLKYNDNNNDNKHNDSVVRNAKTNYKQNTKRQLRSAMGDTTSHFFNHRCLLWLSLFSIVLTTFVTQTLMKCRWSLQKGMITKLIFFSSAGIVNLIAIL